MFKSKLTLEPQIAIGLSKFQFLVTAMQQISESCIVQRLLIFIAPRKLLVLTVCASEVFSSMFTTSNSEKASCEQQRAK